MTVIDAEAEAGTVAVDREPSAVTVTEPENDAPPEAENAADGAAETAPPEPLTEAELLALSEPMVRATGPLSSEVIIPIDGAIRDAISYKLRDGRSAAVNLPTAQVRVAARDYKFERNGVLWVWIRPRQSAPGTHVRVIAGSRVSENRIVLEQDRIRFLLEFRE